TLRPFLTNLFHHIQVYFFDLGDLRAGGQTEDQDRDDRRRCPLETTICHVVFLQGIPEGRYQLGAVFCLSFVFEFLVLTINHCQECLFRIPRRVSNPAATGSYVKPADPVAPESKRRHLSGASARGLLAASASAMLKMTSLLNINQPVEAALE